MASTDPTCYTLMHVPNDVEFPKEETLKEKLEKGLFA